MAGESESSKSESLLLRDILDAWVNRNERTAARDANSLAFWRDGMLAQLEKIAVGTETDKTFADLEKNYNESARRVERTTKKLKHARRKLESGIAHQIDAILSHHDFGKGTIRQAIESVISDHKQGLVDVDTRHLAAMTCLQIKTFNAELGRLNRMVR